MEVEEQAGRDAASAAEARKAKVVRCAESFIVMGARAKSGVLVIRVSGVCQGAWKKETRMEAIFNDLK